VQRIPRSDSPRRVTHPSIFSRLSTSILTDLTKDFTQALPTSNVTPTPIPYSDSSRRVNHHSIFSRLSTPIFTHHQAVEPYLQRHPYTLTYLHALHTLKCWPMAGHPCPATCPHIFPDISKKSHPEEIPRKKSKAQVGLWLVHYYSVR